MTALQAAKKRLEDFVFTAFVSDAGNAETQKEGYAVRGLDLARLRSLEDEIVSAARVEAGRPF